MVSGACYIRAGEAMKIIEPYARMMGLHDSFEGIERLRSIEWCSRISHRSEEAVTPDSWQRIIKAVVLEHGDWSVAEHVHVSVDAYVDRGITHEWVRHRLFSYTQESTRFVNYEKKMLPSFIYPKPEVGCNLCLAGNQHPENSKTLQAWFHNGGEYCPYDSHWLREIDSAESTYKTLLFKGWRPQEARSVFPNALASRLIVTGNLRNWRHFFIMRTTQEAHPQMRQVTIPLLAEFKAKIPLLYDDIEPNQKQSESMKKAR